MFLLYKLDDTDLKNYNYLDLSSIDDVVQLYSPDEYLIVEVSEQQVHGLVTGSLLLDHATKTIIQADADALLQIKLVEESDTARRYLISTDWKVMRHIRELALGLATTLTAEEYLSLEQSRADAAAKVISS